MERNISASRTATRTIIIAFALFGWSVESVSVVLSLKITNPSYCLPSGGCDLGENNSRKRDTSYGDFAIHNRLAKEAEKASREGRQGKWEGRQGPERGQHGENASPWITSSAGQVAPPAANTAAAGRRRPFLRTSSVPVKLGDSHLLGLVSNGLQHLLEATHPRQLHSNQGGRRASGV